MLNFCEKKSPDFMLKKSLAFENKVVILRESQNGIKSDFSGTEMLTSRQKPFFTWQHFFTDLFLTLGSRLLCSHHFTVHSLFPVTQCTFCRTEKQNKNNAHKSSWFRKSYRQRCLHLQKLNIHSINDKVHLYVKVQLKPKKICNK